MNFKFKCNICELDGHPHTIKVIDYDEGMRLMGIHTEAQHGGAPVIEDLTVRVAKPSPV